MPLIYLRKLTIILWYHLIPSPYSNFFPNFPPNVFLQLTGVLLICIIYVHCMLFFSNHFSVTVLFDSYNFPLKSEVGFVEFILQLSKLANR